MLTARGLVAGPLRGADLALAPGEVVVLTGEGGCGTSTLLRVLAGQQAPASGSVVRDAGAPAPVLLDAPPGTEWDDAEVAGELAPPEALRALGMTSPPDREMWMLSGGERQRVRLARVLSGPPGGLLLDEPLGLLDGAGVRAVLDGLRAHADRGGAVLVVAKTDPRAAAVADRVLELADGRLHPVGAGA